jgi:hypothetical protein
MRALAAFLFTVLMVPVNAFMTSWTISKLWTWFMAEDFGPSPSYGALYGVTSILFLVLGLSLVNVKKVKVEDKDHVSNAVTTTLGMTLSCLIALGFAYVVGHVTGMIL